MSQTVTSHLLCIRNGALLLKRAQRPPPCRAAVVISLNAWRPRRGWPVVYANATRSGDRRTTSVIVRTFRRERPDDCFRKRKRIYETVFHIRSCYVLWDVARTVRFADDGVGVWLADKRSASRFFGGRTNATRVCLNLKFRTNWTFGRRLRTDFSRDLLGIEVALSIKEIPMRTIYEYIPRTFPRSKYGKRTTGSISGGGWRRGSGVGPRGIPAKMFKNCRYGRSRGRARPRSSRGNGFFTGRPFIFYPPRRLRALEDYAVLGVAPPCSRVKRLDRSAYYGRVENAPKKSFLLSKKKSLPYFFTVSYYSSDLRKNKYERLLA